MGKSALLAIAAFTIMGTFYSLSSEQNVLKAERELASHQYQALARNAAQLGFERAKETLAESFTSHASISGTYGENDEATYEVTFETNESTIQSALQNLGLTSDPEIMVTSVGTVDRPGENSAEVKIVSVLREKTIVDSEISDEVPEFMQYAIISESDLDLNGNVTVETNEDLLVEGSKEAVYNANIHTNGSLALSGGAASIRGFGTYVDYDNVQHDEVFDPYENSAGDPVVQKVDQIDIPTASFDPAAIYDAHFSSNKKETPSYTLSANQDFIAEGATRQNPMVWHVQGDLTVDGNVQIDGYVMFLVDGDVNFTGNMQAGNSGSDQTESHMALYAGGNVDIGGTVDVLSGQVYSQGNVTYHGTPTITGTVVAGNTATLKGTPNIYYHPASPALTRIWNPHMTVMELAAYSEW